MPRLTVAIPLFRGAPWYETIVQNILRIPANTRIVLSDEVGSDDTAQLVANNFKDDARIAVRVRNGRPGWREHFNSLIHECETELFSLLPQDDLIEPGYYEKLVSGLDENPEACLAFGTLIAEGGRFHQPTRLSLPRIPLGVKEPWMEAIELEVFWNLGIAFRGVVRRTALRPIPSTPGDRFADQRWVFGMALSAHLLFVPDAVYNKRYHDQNTHERWEHFGSQDRKAQLVAEIRSVFGEDENAERAIHYLEQKLLELNIMRWRKLGIC